MSISLNQKETSITRRQALQLVLLTSGSVVAGDWLAACGGSNTRTTQQSGGVAPTPRNQTVIIDGAGQFSVFDSFNPFIPNGEQYDGGLTQVCSEFLFYYNLATGETKPWLAKEWKYNADNTELTITLNPKVHWNDGVPFTAKDIKFTIEMLMGNSALAGSDTYRQAVKTVAAPDDHTVVFSLKQGNPRFHYNFVCGIIWAQRIVPAHIWSKQDPLKFKDNPPVRTGPYKLDRTYPSQFMFIWKKDPNYWNKDELDPKPEYVVYRTAPAADSEVEEFKRAQIDVPANSFDYTHALAIKNSGYKNMVISTKFRDPDPRAIAINCDPSKGLLSDPRMHWAISYLINRQQIGESVWPIATPPAQFPWADYQSNAKWSDKAIAAKYQFTYNPQKAIELLNEMGTVLGSDGKRTYKGQPLHYEISTSSKVGDPEYIYGQKLAEELNKVGIDATVRAYSGAVWYDRLYRGNFDLATWWINGGVLDPSTLYAYFEIRNTKPIGQDASSGGNIFRAKYQELSDAAGKLDTIDPNSPNSVAEFNQTLEAYYKYLPFIPICQATYATVFNSTYWVGWPTDENLYQVPSSWWGQFLFVLGSLKPTGQA
ncbi:ABC transporter substrate-binding protein [Ktedonosporobacter rubrisoli]|uniref:ABC transporter substrate-binding protein n=1 Tax=Ktedonosporobacter rubrisoli TaxID=2509675 RepID=A0A4P6JR52_KTERU|nr:ABC transporter substrate-binding protein [Ktedonosporobacter rubrisoli]QBD77804.1 ABC transporter substrate-binding protein [Ktedonosporobacter rubrisoli]